MKIGEFARLGSLSIRMLRHYDDIGLLRPQRVDPLTGYREYSVRQLRQLRRIQALRSLGFTLEETQDLLGCPPSPEDFAARLRAKRAEVQVLAEDATARLARLDAWLLAPQQESSMSEFPVTLKPLPALLIASVRDPALQVMNDGGGLDISAMYERLFAAVPPSERALPQLNLWTDAADGPSRVEVAQVLSRPIEVPEGVEVYTLSGWAQAATLIYLGHYADPGMVEAFAQLHEWVEASSYREAGPTRQVFLRSVEAGSKEAGVADRFEIELQLPVEAK